MNRTPFLLAFFLFAAAGSARAASFTSVQQIPLPHAHERTIGSFGNGPVEFSEPTDVLHAGAQIYVVDHENHRVQILTQTGGFIGEFGSIGGVPSFAPGEFNFPRAIAQDPVSGNLYVTDTNNNRVQIFDESGAFISEFGSPGGLPGSGPGEFDFPTGIAFHAILDQVFVVDSNNNRVQIFSSGGGYLSEFGSPGGIPSAAPAEFDFPVGIGIAPPGNVYVTERNNHRVQYFEPTGFYLGQWGTFGAGNGQFNNPIAVEYDGAGHIYVSDWLNARIQIFDDVGNYITQLKPSMAGVLSGMEGMAFDFAGAMFVANGFNNTVERLELLDVGQYNSLVERNGDLLLSTYDPTGGNLVFGFRPPGGVWEFELVDVDGNVGLHSSLAVDSGGNPHISYYDADLSDLKYATRSGGGAWILETVRTGAGIFGQYSSLALDSADRPHIAYTDDSSESLEYSDRSTGSWIHWTLGGAGIYSVSLALDSFDFPHVAYLDDRQIQPDEIRYAENLGDGWTFAIVDSSGGTGGNGHVSLALDSFDVPSIGYRLGGNQVRLARWNGLNWGIAIVEAVGASDAAGLYASLRLDPVSEEPRIAYGTTVLGADSLHYAERNGGLWAVQSVAAVNVAGSLFTSLALDDAGNPRIIYSGSLNLAEGVALTARYVVPNTGRAAGPQAFTLHGPSVGIGPPTSVLLLKDGSPPIAPNNVGTVGPDVLDLEFDLTGADLGSYQLYLQNAAGEATLQDAIVVYADPLDLRRVTTQPSQERFAVATRPGVSEQIAFLSDREGGAKLFVKDPVLPDFNTAVSTGSRTDAQVSSWSPGGDLIVHDTPTGELYRVDVLSGGVTTLIGGVTGAAFPSWSPMDNRIAYTDLSGTGAVVVLDTGTMMSTAITTPAAPGVHSGAEWSPDGARIAFAGPDSSGPPSVAVYSVSVAEGQAGGLKTVVPGNGFLNGSPAWSPDGRWIAFASDRSGNQDIWIASSNGEQYGLLQVTDDAAADFEPNWSPDGTMLYFTSNRASPSNTDIYAAEVAPLYVDTDGDLVPDFADLCPSEAPVLGETDRDGNGCVDLTGSFRFMRFWSDDQLPVMYRTDAMGDSSIGDDSEFTELAASFAAWTTSAIPTVLTGGDDGTRAGPSDAVSGDALNSVVFHDADGFELGTIAITLSAVAVEDTVINGRWYRPGEIVDADLLFNTFHYDFSTPSAPGPLAAFNLANVAMHEFGHFFGIGHDAIPTATMFYVVRADDSQGSLEASDVVTARRGYNDPGAGSLTATVQGQVVRGEDGVTPVVGAAVFAIDAASGDSLEMTLTDLDGRYRFFLPLGGPDFRIFMHPLDGSPGISGLRPRNIHPLFVPVAEDDYLPEYWDGVAETNSDFGSPGAIGMSSSFPILGANIITNPDLSPPAVVSTFPAAGDTVPVTTAVTVKFDDRIDLSSVSSTTFSLEETISTAGVGGNAGLLQFDSLLVFQPDTLLAYDTQYTLTVGPGITDQFGNAMTTTVIVQFRTQVQPPATVTAVSPAEVPVGGILVVQGTGFSPTASANEVFFTGGVSAFPFAATLEQLVLTVPTGAQTGNIYVEVNGGAETSNLFPVVIVPPRGVPVGTALGSASLGGDPRRVTVTPDGGWAYVAHASGVTAVRADPAFADFLTNTADITLTGGSRGVAATPDGSRVLAVSSVPPVLQAIDVDPSSILFNTVIPGTTVPLGGEPLGLALVPGGGHALVAYATRVVQHVATEGPLFGQATREWTLSGPSFTGDIAVSVDAGEAYAATTDGQIAVLGLAPGEGIVALLPGGPSPRESAGRPDAQRFLSVDENGTIREYGKRGPSLSATSVGGGYTGLVLTPDGSYALAANFILNRVDVFGLTSSTPSMVSSIATGVDPTDVTTGNSGRYLYVTTAASDRLEVYDTEAGPVISEVFPRSVPGGGWLTLIGSGLAPGSLVNFGGVVVAADSARSDSSALSVRVPATAPPGRNPLSVTTDGQISNTAVYKRVDRPDEGNLDVTLVTPMPTVQSMVNVMEVPTGEYLITTYADASMIVVAADPSRSDFLRPVQTLIPTETGLTFPGGGSPHQLAVTPDGTRMYGISGSTVAVFDITSGDPAPVSPVGSVVDGGGISVFGPETLAMTPDGKRLLAVSVEGQEFFTVNTATDSLENTFNVPCAFPVQLAVHPNGGYAFVGDRDDVTGFPQVQAVDLNEDSPTYGQAVDSSVVALGGTGGWSTPLRMLPTPDGSKLLVLTSRPIGLSGEYEITEIDIDPAGPGFMTQGATYTIAIDFDPVLVLNHSGTVLFSVNLNSQSLDAWDVATGTPLGSTGFYVQFGGSRTASLSLDDGRLYTSGISPVLIVADVTGASAQTFVSGTGQVGVVNQPLAAPIVAQLTNPGDPNPVEGAVAAWTAGPGSGDYGWGDRMFYTAADEAGYVSAAYTAGPAAKPDTVNVVSAVGTISASITVVADPGVSPPQLLGVLPTPATPAGVTTTIAADFSKAINRTTVSNATFIVRRPGGSALPGVYTAATGNTRMVFRPAVALDYSTLYEVELTAGIQDGSANPLSNPGVFNFTTKAPPPHPVFNSVAASSAVPGNTVVLAGTGFAPTASVNLVTFGGGATSAVPVRGGTNSLTVVVPYTAFSGNMTVITNPGTAPDTSNARTFTVLPAATTPVTEVVGVVDVPSSGQQIAVLPDGTRSYMTSSGANTVVPVNLSTSMPETAVSVGQHPFGIAAGPNSDHVYVTNFFSNNLSVIGTDPDSAGFHTVVATIATGVNPTGVAVHPDGNTVYVVNYGDSTLSIIDSDPESALYLSAKQSIDSNTTSKTVAVTPDGLSLVLGTSEGLLILDAEDGAAQKSITTGKGSKTVAVTPDGAYTVILTDDDYLLLIDIQPGTPDGDRAKSSVNTNKKGAAVAISPDGAFVYVTTEDDEVLVYAIVTLGAGGATPSPQTGVLGFQLIASVPVGENPIGMAVDYTTNTLLVVNSGDLTITFINISDLSTGPVATQLDMDPNSLNLKSKGKSVNAALQFPVYLDPAHLVLTSVLMNNTLAPDTSGFVLLDKNEDGIDEAHVKFSRPAVFGLLPQGQEVPVVITGLVGERPFTARDTIRVFRPGIVSPAPGQVVAADAPFDIAWLPSPDGPAHHMDIFWSGDLGATWDTVAVGTEDDSVYTWSTPDVATDQSLLLLVARDSKDAVMGIGTMDDPFTISRSTGVEGALPARFALFPASPNPFGAATNLRFDLPEAAEVSLLVFALDGSLVRTLADGEPYPAGRHAVLWDGRNALGQRTSGGVYFVRIQAGEERAVRKIVRLSR